MENLINNILGYFKEHQILKEIVIVFLIIISCYISYYITRKIIFKWIEKLVKKSKTTLDDLIFNNIISRRLSYLPSLLIIYYFSYLYSGIDIHIRRISLSIIFFIALTTTTAFIRAINTIYDKKKQFKGRSIKGYIQAIIIILYIIGAFIIIGIITNQSILVLLSGVGALTAVLMLVFRDTILSFIASIEITTNDLVRVGDWIEVKTFGADGDVIDIALHTIKIQNWDKTITVIPTHKLIDGSFKNWRGMTDSGGRRIKRIINIDLSSIKICTDEMINKYQKINILKPYLEKKTQEIDEDNKTKKIMMNDSLVNGRRLTNIGTFRAYIKAYLKNHPNIKNDMTFLVRQLQSSSEGLPIEIYVFSNDIEWANYESIQADIMDHIFSITKEFDLKIFQYYSSNIKSEK